MSFGVKCLSTNGLRAFKVFHSIVVKQNSYSGYAPKAPCRRDLYWKCCKLFHSVASDTHQQTWCQFCDLTFSLPRSAASPGLSLQDSPHLGINELRALSAECPHHSAQLSETSLTHSTVSILTHAPHRLFFFSYKLQHEIPAGVHILFYYVRKNTFQQALVHRQNGLWLSSTSVFSPPCISHVQRKNNAVAVCLDKGMRLQLNLATTSRTYLCVRERRPSDSIPPQRTSQGSRDTRFDPWLDPFWPPHHYSLLPARDNALCTHLAACIPN